MRPMSVVLTALICTVALAPIPGWAQDTADTGVDTGDTSDSAVTEPPADPLDTADSDEPAPPSAAQGARERGGLHCGAPASPPLVPLVPLLLVGFGALTLRRPEPR